MDKTRRAKYLIAVYLLVTVGAIALLLVGINYTKDPIWQGIWINLATGLLGVTFLFFLVDRFFLADEWGLSDRIDQLVNRLELSDRPSAQDFFIKQPELTEYIKNARRIRLCGVTLTSTINRQFGHLRERLSQGAVVQILVADPESLALRMSALRSEKPDDVDYYSKRLESSFKDIGYLYESCYDRDSGQLLPSANGLAVRQLPFAPSFNICQFEGQDGSQVLFVELYTHGVGIVSPPIFTLTPERDRGWYDLFSQQFDAMWEKSRVWQPGKDEEYKVLKPKSSVPASEFLRSQQSLPHHLFENASTICISGYTLTRTVREYLRQFDYCLAAGGNVQIMILESEESLLEECVKRSHGRTTSSHWRKRLESTESMVEVIANAPNNSGIVDLGFLPYLPSFGITMLDPDTDQGVIIVELYHHRSAEDNLTFELLVNRDGERYRFFRQQFEIMWESCRVKQLPETIEN